MTSKRTTMWVAAAACGVVLLGIVIFAFRDRPEDRREVRIVTPSTTAPAPAPPPPSPATAATSLRASQPSLAAATTAPAEPSLDQRLAAAQQQAQAAHADLQAARKAVLDRLAQRADYQRERQAFDAAEAKLKTLRQTNEQPALAAVSQDW